MTKSTITRERLQEIAEDGFLKHGESKELARMVLAGMDSSESVELPLDYLQGHKDGLEWAAQLAEANHPETGDWLYDDPIELAKAIRKGPDMPPAQPVADSEPVAEVVSIYGDPEAFGEREIRPLVGIQQMPYGTKLYRHAQQPVVPDDVLAALQKVARIRLDLNGFDGDRRGIADCLGNAEEALIEVVNRRAAMLQTKSLTSINPAPALVSLQKNAKSLTGNYPAIPDGYVMVPVEPNGDMLAAAQDAYGETDGDIASTLRAAMLAAAQQEGK
ncbi:Uncharacterised protein [Klebsiella pneumoniae]|uniref:DUF551 domain-containing protein n=1 Tax=Klebsiella pneumoniae TaxID=573 RepID=UPI000E2D0477|nr:Uncharacterised protein [Klebsiella pneumoniae]SWA01399.1 Uncharacterised protein [Klebsiella pneumoniae]SWA22680.1 Uncharacterised protein [Klebsiella pneumoniae]